MRKRFLAMLCSSLLLFTSCGIKTPNQSTDGADESGGNKEMQSLKEPQELSADYVLKYTSPADPNSYDDWEQLSLPVGNGDIGGNVFGAVEKERITLNEKTMWTGGPSESRPNYNGGNIEANGRGGETVKEVQKLFAEGRDEEASELCDKLVGDSDGYGGYQQFGNLYLDFGSVEKVENYSRSLDIVSATAHVEYDADGVHYRREIFASNPADVFVVRLTSEGGELNLNVGFEPENGGAAPRSVNTETSSNSIAINGELNDNGLKYSGYLEIVTPESDQVSADGGKLVISGTNEATIILSMTTDYALSYPTYRTGETQEELLKKIKTTVKSAAEKTYESLRLEHIADFSSIMARTDLDIGQAEPDMTTDQLLSAYKSGTLSADEKAYLEVLLFQYGRYLLISSSRENSVLPANLQGLWVGRNGSAWNSDYHINVNLQMNYWPAYVTNLTECAVPMINYVNGFREPGRNTAEIYFGVKSTEGNPENGFTANTTTTPFGWTAPGSVFDWGWSPASVPWMLQNVWEYYEYTLDRDYLAQTIYPMLKEEAKFYSQILIEDENGRLISTPAYSPEHGPRTNGNTYEQSLIWQLFTDTITAGEIVGEDEDLLSEWRDILSRLRDPIEIGDDGQIKEWYSETTLGSAPKSDAYGHRHLSHLLGLYPGDLITADTPEWFEAARVSLDARVDASTGWAMGQRINSWARLQDGEHMYQLVETLIRNGILNNLWDTHPPFQIDGNFGYTSGIAEALIQSHTGYINILPALPSEWDSGSVSGLVARGNFEIGFDWNDGSVAEIRINSRAGGECRLKTVSEDITVIDSDGNDVNFEISDGLICFETSEGKNYTVKNNAMIGTPKIKEVLRISDSEIKITWDPAERAESYCIYRSDGSTEALLASDISATEYTDANAAYENDDIFYSYRISAVNEGGFEGDRSPDAAEQGWRNITVDSNDSRVKYSGQWQLYNEGDHYMSTNNCSWTPGSYAELEFTGTGIELYSVAKPNYNGVNIYIDNEKVGDYYLLNASSITPNTLVFSKTDLEYGKHTIKVEVMQDIVTGVGNQSISIDYFKVYAEK